MVREGDGVRLFGFEPINELKLGLSLNSMVEFATLEGIVPVRNVT
jgi:hypothetical protein